VNKLLFIRKTKETKERKKEATERHEGWASGKRTIPPLFFRFLTSVLDGTAKRITIG